MHQLFKPEQRLLDRQVLWHGIGRFSWTLSYCGLEVSDFSFAESFALSNSTPETELAYLFSRSLKLALEIWYCYIKSK